MQRKAVVEAPSAAASKQAPPSLLPGDGSSSGPQRKTSFALSGRTPSISSQSRPSIVGILASKRLAMHLSSKALRKRSSIFEVCRISQAPKKEPTYRMAPDRKFLPGKVEDCVKEILQNRLERFSYVPKLCGNMCKVISDEIKYEVKSMNFDRYRIVCSVTIGQLKDQGAQVASRCAWDEKLDNFAAYTFRNDNIFCTALVFGVYTE